MLSLSRSSDSPVSGVFFDVNPLQYHPFGDCSGGISERISQFNDSFADFVLLLALPGGITGNFRLFGSAGEASGMDSEGDDRSDRDSLAGRYRAPISITGPGVSRRSA
jgi:hypothetical protein